MYINYEERERERNSDVLMMMMMMMMDSSSTASVEHGLDVLPGVHACLGVERRRRGSPDDQFEMTAPRVEVGRVGMIVDCRH